MVRNDNGEKNMAAYKTLARKITTSNV
jgi:hypothetical protein